MGRYIVDMEANGLNPDKIYVFSIKNIDNKRKFSTTNYEEMTKFLTSGHTIIGHNIICFDIPVFERLLKIKVNCRPIDTLALSRYLYPNRDSHGLGAWGEELGVKKPEIEDWHNLTVEEYTHRCEEDVEINFLLWEKMFKLLFTIYENDVDANRMIDYLSFKMHCLRLQAESKWRIDTDLCLKEIEKLTLIKAEKTEELASGMPKVPVTAKRTRPKICFKKDGTLSANGEKWFDLLREHKLPEDYSEEVIVTTGWEEPNPDSSLQRKNWLFSLGWQPTIFKYQRNKVTGETKAIPQIRNDKSGDMCEHIVELSKTYPELNALVGYSILSHRIPFLKRMVEDSEDGFIIAGAAGFTNTLRLIHAGLVNLPRADRQYADGIRASLMAREGYELCGSDQSGLEDRIKQHFIYEHDPEYVEQMSSDDWDPHLTLAVLGGAITEEEKILYIQGDKDTKKRLKPIRDIWKNGNYAGQYGAGGKRIALTANVSESEGIRIHKIYWELNWAIKKVAELQTVKEVDGQLWLLNPISKFWYSLRYMKDVFSTLVQGTAAYVFDKWVEIVVTKRPQLTAQFHDEIVLEIKKGHREECIKLLKDAIAELNDMLKLNRKLDVDIQFGERYSEIH